MEHLADPWAAVPLPTRALARMVVAGWWSVTLPGPCSVGADSWDSRSEDDRTPIQDHELDAMVYDPS